MEDLGTSVRIGIVAVNLVIWTGLFLYLLRLGARLRRLEEETKRKEIGP
jgi:CcmD family protein